MRIFSFNFWAAALMSTFITMICIFLFKKFNDKVKIPLVSDVIESV